MSTQPKPLSEYVKRSERMEYLKSTLSVAEDLKTVCIGSLLDIYRHELSHYPNRREILVSSTFLRSILPLLTALKGTRSVTNLRGAVNRYLLYSDIPKLKSVSNQRYIVPRPIDFYVTDAGRMADLKARLSSVTTIKELCTDVLSDLYDHELSSLPDRHSVVVNTTFLLSLIPLLPTDAAKWSVLNIRDGVRRHIQNRRIVAARRN